MNKEKHNPNFDINTKYEDIINNSKKIAELHEFVSDGSCEPPSYICLAYDVKNYLPRLIKENQQLKEQLERSEKARKEAIEFINELADDTDDTTCYEINKKRKEMIIDILDIDKGE